MFSVTLSVAFRPPAFRWHPFLRSPDFPLLLKKKQQRRLSSPCFVVVFLPLPVPTGFSHIICRYKKSISRQYSCELKWISKFIVLRGDGDALERRQSLLVLGVQARSGCVSSARRKLNARPCEPSFHAEQSA